MWAYWRPIYAGAPHLQGGFIWEWADHGLRAPVPSTRKVEHVENTKSLPLDPALGSFFAYGGSFGAPGRFPHDGNFCADGIVSPDRTPHPGLAEAKKIYQPIQMRPAQSQSGSGVPPLSESGRMPLPPSAAATDYLITLTNWSDFRDTAAWLDATWRITADGHEIRSGKLTNTPATAAAAFSLAPRETKTVAIPGALALPREPNVEYFLEVSFTLRNDTPWAAAGHEVAWEQFPLPLAATTPAAATPAAGAAAPPIENRVPSEARSLTSKIQNPSALACDAKSQTPSGQSEKPDNPKSEILQPSELQVFRTSTFTATFDRATGYLVSLKTAPDATELLASPLAPHYWRAPVDNDRGNNMTAPGKPVPGRPSAYAPIAWRTAPDTWKLARLDTRTAPDGSITLTATGRLESVNRTQTLTWTIRPDGDILVTLKLHGDPDNRGAAELPRFGMQTTLRPGFDNLAWLGKGPHETYWDRQDARVGLYKGKVRDQFYPYLKPQETGNHESVRWLALTDAQGRGLLAVALPGQNLLSANALHYTTDDLHFPTHKEGHYYPYQLPKRDTITLNLDLHQRGLGGDDSWRALPHDDYRLTRWALEYTYRLRPLSPGDDPAKLARQK
jgi:beta-galactosidase